MPKYSSLLEILQHHFETNAELKQKCLVDAKYKIDRNLSNRVFDEFPLLIEQSIFLSFIDKFTHVLQQPTPKSVRDFEMGIIQIACDELLDKQGKLKNQLIKTLEWNELTSQIDNYNAVCAFVGAITAYVVRESAALIQENNDKFTAAATHINRNYGKWVLEMMREKGLAYNPIYNTDQLNIRDIMLYPIKKPGFGVSLLFGGFIGAAIYSGYELYKKSYEDNATLESPENEKNKLKPS